MGDEEKRRSFSRERSPAGDRERHDATEQPPEEPSKEEFKCFVGGIPWQVKDSSLQEIFAEFNPTDASVMLEKHSRRSRGFGFVWFADEAAREAAVAKHHGTELEPGRKISVTKAIPQSQTAPGTPADALRRGQTVPRDQGRVRRNGGSGGDRGRDRRYDRGGNGSYRRDYSRDRDDRGRDSYRDSYDRDRYSYRGSGYDRGYDRGYSGGGGGVVGGGGSGGSYRPGYGFSSGTNSRDYEPNYSSYQDRRPSDVYAGGTDRYYEPYVPRSDSSYAARPPPSRYEPAAPYYGGGGVPASRDIYGVDRHERTGRLSGPYDRPAY